MPLSTFGPNLCVQLKRARRRAQPFFAGDGGVVLFACRYARDMAEGRRLRALAAAALCAACVTADEYTHKYEQGELVNLWVNKVGPYHNPQETYVYYSLPFCRPKKLRPSRAEQRRQQQLRSAEPDLAKATKAGHLGQSQSQY